MSSVYDTLEWAAWLASIREMPDDDNRRLFAADFLEERGEGERAEFIRDQCAGTRGRINPPRARKWFAPFPWEGSQLAFSTAKHRCLIRQRYGATGTPPNAPAVEVRRGFVSRVSGPLVSLIGGDCGRCASRRHMALWIERLEGEAARVDATGLADDLMGLHDPCPACDGTGRTPGVLRELVKREPVAATGVEVTDRVPQEDHIYDLPFGWCRGGTLSARYCLPSEVWDILEGHKPQGWRERGGNGWFCSYPTADAARAALSAAILRLVQPVEVPT